jgi:hypothetical protein
MPLSAMAVWFDLTYSFAGGVVVRENALSPRSMASPDCFRSKATSRGVNASKTGKLCSLGGCTAGGFDRERLLSSIAKPTFLLERLAAGADNT